MTSSTRNEASAQGQERVASILRTIAIAAVLIGIVWLMSDVLLLVFAAVLIGIALRGLASALAHGTGLSARVCIAIVCVVTILLFAAAIWFWGTDLASASGQFVDLLRSNLAALRQRIEETSWGRSLVKDVSTSQIFKAGRAVGGNIAGVAFSTFGIAGSVLLTAVTGIYLALDPGTYTRACTRLVPVDYRDRFRDILDHIHRALGLWLLGRAIDMAVVFIMTYLGLWLLQSPAALPLAVVAAVLNFVPYIGAIAGAVPAVLVALSSGPMEAVYVAALFTGIQMIEGYVLSPVIQKKTVSLPPALTILSQTVFGTLFGALGLLLAPALAVVAMLAVRMGYVEDVLESDQRAQ